jgi:hypothetical protein
MLKKTITYTDYNGVEHTEDFFFNITKAELADMQMSEKDGYDVKLKSIIASEDHKSIYETFKYFIHMSYGEKSADGKRFMKKDPVTGTPLYLAFMETEAYSELVFELVQSDETMAAFINGIMPKEVSDQLAAQGHK